jgi:hypothetical protein
MNPMTPLRRAISGFFAITLTLAGVVLSYWEFTAQGRLPPKIWWVGPFMAILGFIWLLDDFRGRPSDASDT